MTADSVAPVLSPDVRALISAMDAVCAATPAEVPGPVALEETRALLRAKEKLDAHLLSRVRDVEVRQLHEYDALPSVGSWVEVQTTSVTRRDVSLARRLDRLPAVRRELESGRLSILGAQRIGDAIDKVRGFLDAKDGLIDGLPAEDVLDGAAVRRGPRRVGRRRPAGARADARAGGDPVVGDVADLARRGGVRRIGDPHRVELPARRAGAAR
jgi:hypothetical protein